ncbi:unnamed protein product [Oreochromis niloticus]|nr:unnamed protein product [Mustela putorius furo]
MLDSGSMACTLSTNMMPQLLHHAVLPTPTLQPTDVVLIGCGGSRTVPSGVCDITVEMYGCKVVVPMLVIAGQSEDLILGSNLMRYLGNRLREEGHLGEECSKTLSAEEQPNKNLLSSMSGVVAPGHVGDKIGTVKLKRAVTLEPLTEHLVWGRLQLMNSGEVGSAVVVEPTGSRSGPRSVMVGRTVAHLNSDGWLPVKVLNPFDKPITLKRNMKLADVSPCAAVENFSPTGSYLQQNMQRSTGSAWCHDEQSLVTDVSTLPDDSPSQEMTEAEAVATGGVQEAFRWTVHSADKASSNDQPVVSQCTAVAQTGMLTSSEVGAVFQAYSDHESRVWPHALLLPQCSQTVLTPNQCGSEPFSHDDLVGHQRRDDVLCRVISYVVRGRRPSRRERANEPVDTKRLLKAWDKLTVRDGVLYRVSRNPVTKTKTHLVPRLPIDVIFGSVIEHQDIMDYNRYVQTLRRDLKEAMDLAQEVARKNLKRHTDLYNRKVRGAPVVIVFDKNDESHTFKLMDDSTGQVKVVHRNLIMPVNFLPLSGASVQDDGDELSESGSLMVGCDGEAVCNSSVGTAEYRTRTWVSDLPSAVSSDSLMTEVTQPEGSIVDQELACTSVPPVDTEEQVNATSGGQHSDLLMSVVPVNASSVLELAATTDGDQDNAAAIEGHVSTTVVLPNADPTEVSRVVGARARSRVGRLLKPVSRLIEMMHQRPVKV